MPPQMPQQQQRPSPLHLRLLQAARTKWPPAALTCQRCKPRRPLSRWCLSLLRLHLRLRLRLQLSLHLHLHLRLRLHLLLR